ncbi:MAG: CHAP domain-containing protein [Faecousia sp.]
MITEKKQKTGKIIPVLILLLFAAAIAAHYALEPWDFYRKVPDAEASLRLKTVRTAEGYLGCCEADGSHEAIIDLYNSHEPLAQGYTVQYTDSWCAAFVSTMSIQCGLTEILPTECSCQRLIGLFQDMDCWEEDDGYIPLPGDVIFYDWDEKGLGDCTGWSDHVGIVVGTKWPFLKVIEGNKDDAVSYRVIPLSEIHIRGFGLPDYAAIAENDP